jgi:hypothetical protein
MSRLKMFLLVAPTLFLAACSGIAGLGPATQTALPSISPADTVTLEPPPTSTLTMTPTLAPSATSVPPTSTATTDISKATEDAYRVSMAALVGSMGYLEGVGQYLDPVGTPVKTWNGVPVMTQATSGQEFSKYVYSYIATATIAQATQYYDSHASSLGIPTHTGSGHGGTGTNATHFIAYTSYGLSLYVTSFDNNTSHVIVVISKYP